MLKEKAEQIAKKVTELRPNWIAFAEYPGNVAVHRTCLGNDVLFGDANETFGGTIYTSMPALLKVLTLD